MKSVVIDKFVTVGLHYCSLPSIRGRCNLLKQSQNYDEVHVSEVAAPTPKDDEILVQVKAAGVNFVDTLYVCWLSIYYCYLEQ